MPSLLHSKHYFTKVDRVDEKRTSAVKSSESSETVEPSSSSPLRRGSTTSRNIGILKGSLAESADRVIFMGHNLTQTLLRTCHNLTQTLLRTCHNLIQTLPRICHNLTQTLPYVGDLNYRIRGTRALVDQMLAANLHELMVENDQLVDSMRKKEVLEGFVGEIHSLPLLPNP